MSAYELRDASGAPFPCELLDFATWTQSAMPAGVASELLRRMDWTPTDDGYLLSPGRDIRVPMDAVKEVSE